MASSIYDVVVQILTDEPNLSNEQVAAKVQQVIPGANTSAASVASTKSRARTNGDLQAAPASMPRTAAFVPDEDLGIPGETEEERSVRIRTRYSTLQRMAERIAAGKIPSLIVSGPPGLGKSYTVEKVLETAAAEEDGDGLEFQIISGTISPVGLYIALWNLREGGVLVLDDCDDVFRDETCLNLLKAVLDSSSERRVSYGKRAHWLEEEGIDASFVFKGSAVFCTNLDFEVSIQRGSAMAPHYAALIDRSLYLSLTMRTKADFLCRLRQVAIEDGMLVGMGLTPEEATQAMAFVVEKAPRFYSLSLRLMGQVGACILADPERWQEDVEATKMRTI